MAALHQLVQLKEAGAPFYSVETAKDRIEQVGIVGPAFQLDQLLGQLLKNFAGFYQKLEDFFIGAEAHQRCSLKTQAGQQIIDIVLTGHDVFTLIGMNLRTFTPSRMFF